MLAMFFCAQLAYGQSATIVPEQLSDQTGVGKITLPWSSTSRASVFGEVRFESMQYMTTLKDESSLTYSQFLSGRIKGSSYNKAPLSFNWAADLSAGTFFAAKQSYYSVQEIYGSTPLSENVEVSVGRKKYDWTEIDRVWSLGLWQPRYAIDALRPEDQGLTGAFIDLKRQYVQLLLFGSPVFIPTMGPDVREQDGTIKSDNRWYRPPSRQAGNIDVSYKLNTGDTWNLVNQTSYGARLRVGETDRGAWFATAAGHKPVNDLILERCLHCVAVNSQATFVVSPKVDYHEVYSADLGYKFENVNYSISYFEDHPKTVLPPEDYAVQQLHPVKIYSAQMEWDINDFLSRSFQVQLAYMRSYGDMIQDIESDGSVSDITIFTYRYRFSNAALARIVSPLVNIYARPLITKFSYTYDFDQEGSILGLEFQYQWNHKWAYLLGTDILSSDNSNSNSDGFINTFRANDRAYAGASYVF
jgi:hypothetical protein